MSWIFDGVTRWLNRRRIRKLRRIFEAAGRADSVVLVDRLESLLRERDLL